jgi:thiosulfate/3-mercaptopyruvate sulfurtransferase
MVSEKQAMSGKALISASELFDLMKAEPVVLIDTRDPAIYAEAHIPGAVDMREVFTYLATSTTQGMAHPFSGAAVLEEARPWTK